MTRHPDLLTRAEAAALLGVSISQLSRGWGQGDRKVVVMARAGWLAHSAPRRDSLGPLATASHYGPAA